MQMSIFGVAFIRHLHRRIVNNNKSQVKRSVQLLPEEFGRHYTWILAPS